MAELTKFRKKPGEVWAVQFTPPDVDPNFLSREAPGGRYELWVIKSDKWCDIEPGDWVIREPDGLGCYPCKRAIFEASYEPADG